MNIPPIYDDDGDDDDDDDDDDDYDIDDDEEEDASGWSSPPLQHSQCWKRTRFYFCMACRIMMMR